MQFALLLDDSIITYNRTDVNRFLSGAADLLIDFAPIIWYDAIKKQIGDNMNDDVNTALALSLLSYFPELSHGGYPNTGAFLDEYFRTRQSLRPETMFSGLCPDDKNGTAAAMKILRRRHFRDLRIVCDSFGSRRYNSFCAVDDANNTAYIVIGGNYRVGFYFSGSGVTSSWCDNFLGAVQNITAEQRDILAFYDRALSVLDGQRIVLCGHSKGGNLAQFITLMRSSADICYSFDGQGFSREFIRTHRRQIQERGSRIISICPKESIVGAALTPLPTAGHYTVRTRPVRKGLLYCHIPAALFGRGLRLGRLTKSPSFTSKLAGRISVHTVAAAQRLPFISAEKGLGHTGKALQYIFKDNAAKGLAELISPDVFALFALALIMLPAEALYLLLIPSGK